MDVKAIIIFSFCWYGATSSVEHLQTAPVVAASSSQFFARTFNRLVDATPVVAPDYPVVTINSVEPTIREVAVSVPNTLVRPPPTTTAVVTPTGATATAQALVQPLLISAPLAVPSGIITPQFQLLPLEDNVRQNIRGLEHNGLVESINTDQVKIKETANEFTELNEDAQIRLNEKRKELLETEKRIIEERSIFEQQYIIKQESLKRQLQQLQLEEKRSQSQQIEQDYVFKQEQIIKEHNRKRQELAQLEQLARENEQTFQQYSIHKQKQLLPQQQLTQQHVLDLQSNQQIAPQNQSPNLIQKFNQQQIINQNIKQQQQIEEHRLKQQQHLNIQKQYQQNSAFRTQQFAKTAIEVVPVPLAYISPPPLKISTIRHFHPSPARLVQLNTHTKLSPLRINGRLPYDSQPQEYIPTTPRARDIELTTVRTSNLDEINRPPRL